MNSQKNQKIVILCGGKGRRLGKVGRELPKSLIKIKGRAILEWKLRHYIKQGFGDFIVCLGYKGGMIRDAISRFSLPARFVFSDAGEPAGILKRVYLARGDFRDCAVLTYGDTFAEINMRELIRKHRSGKNEATIVVAPIKSPFGLVDFDLNGKVSSFSEKPVLNYYIGYAVINRSALDIVPQKVIDMPDGQGIVTFYKILMALGKLGVFYHSGFQMTFNTEDEINIAQEKMIHFYTSREQN